MRNAKPHAIIAPRDRMSEREIYRMAIISLDKPQPQCMQIFSGETIHGEKKKL